LFVSKNALSRPRLPEQGGDAIVLDEHFGDTDQR
jgi:hypothetical protein